jgi:hypothetical protein
MVHVQISTIGLDRNAARASCAALTEEFGVWDKRKPAVRVGSLPHLPFGLKHTSRESHSPLRLARMNWLCLSDAERTANCESAM